MSTVYKTMKIENLKTVMKQWHIMDSNIAIKGSDSNLEVNIFQILKVATNKTR